MEQRTGTSTSTSTHPFSIPAYPTTASRGTWSPSQETTGTKQGTPWTGCQSIAGPNLTRYRQFRNANQPTMHVFGPGRKPEYPEETPEARGEHANSTGV
ncbi:hypothetical protein QTP70_030811 [Hemibagrus guttatus]|uniref:Uncharacterized protein n=1 Tax=Hemibagrus guttatus TaxID=175788 RepID=A0AAE0RLN1_9TELE|nr:hypothetical protein QTP70_030811 [Hemibagrus guttatus]